ncbi:MAG TPA: putative glycoside hydrolase, partial [Bacillota bacterium]|nr:putative glycoside hydrolase [Bacillota bacterium]
DGYQVYGRKQVREQIQATYDSGVEEWLLWNAGNYYTEGALLKD